MILGIQGRERAQMGVSCFLLSEIGNEGGGNKWHDSYKQLTTYFSILDYLQVLRLLQ